MESHAKSKQDLTEPPQSTSYQAKHLLYSSYRLSSKSFLFTDMGDKPTLRIQLDEKGLMKKTAGVIVCISTGDMFKHGFGSHVYQS